MLPEATLVGKAQYVVMLGDWGCMSVQYQLNMVGVARDLSSQSKPRLTVLYTLLALRQPRFANHAAGRWLAISIHLWMGDCYHAWLA